MHCVSDKDIILALRYCVSDTGEFCDMCSYASYGTNCSKRLLKDASNRLKELTSNSEEKKNDY